MIIQLPALTSETKSEINSSQLWHHYRELESASVTSRKLAEVEVVLKEVWRSSIKTISEHDLSANNLVKRLSWREVRVNWRDYVALFGAILSYFAEAPKSKQEKPDLNRLQIVTWFLTVWPRESHVQSVWTITGILFVWYAAESS